MDAERTVAPSPAAPLRLWAWEGGWGIVPLVAVLGGAWASGASTRPEALLPLAVAVAMVVGGWTVSWFTLTATDWQAALRRWRTWRGEAPLPHLPYLQPATPGASLHRLLRRARSWWQMEGRAALGGTLQAAAVALALSLLLGLALGRIPFLLSSLLLAWSQLATLWCGGEGRVGTFWRAVALVGLPWLLGATLAVGDPTPAVLRLTAALICLAACFAHPSLLNLVGPLVAVIVLVREGHPLAAGFLLLLAVPGWMLLPHLAELPPREAERRYRVAIAPWLVAMLLLVAGVWR